MTTPNPALPTLERPPECGPPSASPPALAAGLRGDRRCPKCDLIWFYSRDASGDLACIYCGRVEYGTAPDERVPGGGTAKCGRIVLS